MKCRISIISPLLLLASCTSFAAIHNSYRCRIDQAQVKNHKKLKVILKLTKTAPQTYRVTFVQPKGTPASIKNIDSTLWYVVGNKAIASFHGITPAAGEYYTGTAKILIKKNHLETTFYGYRLAKNGKLIKSTGHLFCKAVTTS